MVLKIFYYRPVTLGISLISKRSNIVCRSVCSTTERHTSSKQSYVVTTPIFYVNSVPHIGHLYTAVVADALARWRKLQGDNVIFSTGTDEHGMKIQREASQQGIEPKSFCDNNAAHFKRLFEATDVNYTDFIRTTEDRHIRSVHALWKTLEERGYIYKGQYEGWYCTPDEAFLSNLDIEEVTRSDGSVVKVSKESGHPVEWLKEDNYLFRLSEFETPLKEWLKGKVIKPGRPYEAVVKEIMSHGLRDLSISRQRDRLSWGIPVPGDDSQTIYVWLDALTNYLTVLGYPDNVTTWPPHCHLVGKDIIKFHAIYWPAFLMAAGLDPPKAVYCHAHWLNGQMKMSKSIGNVVDPFYCIEKYGETALRYYLLREGVPHSDGNFDELNLITYYNGELVNLLANLLSRCLGKKINPQGILPSFDQYEFKKKSTKKDREMWRNLNTLPDRVSQHFENYEIHNAITAVISQLRQTNTFIGHREPWHLVDYPPEKQWLDTILHVCLVTVRISSILLQPVVPALSSKVLDSMCVHPDARTWKHAHKWQESDLGNRPLGKSERVVERL